MGGACASPGPVTSIGPAAAGRLAAADGTVAVGGSVGPLIGAASVGAAGVGRGGCGWRGAEARGGRTRGPFGAGNGPFGAGNGPFGCGGTAVGSPPAPGLAAGLTPRPDALPPGALPPEAVSAFREDSTAPGGIGVEPRGSAGRVGRREGSAWLRGGIADGRPARRAAAPRVRRELVSAPVVARPGPAPGASVLAPGTDGGVSSDVFVRSAPERAADVASSRWNASLCHASSSGCGEPVPPRRRCRRRPDREWGGDSTSSVPAASSRMY
ncbi:hypothetical protein BMG523Draft_00859 [Frankia sp. BMG5.23]|nr:hypothetical protein BMG523Draft_00859 [Frankia sp. BMG5.23]